MIVLFSRGWTKIKYGCTKRAHIFTSLIKVSIIQKHHFPGRHIRNYYSIRCEQWTLTLINIFTKNKVESNYKNKKKKMMVHELEAVLIIHLRSCLYVPETFWHFAYNNVQNHLYSLGDKTAQSSSLVKDTKTDPPQRLVHRLLRSSLRAR